MSPTFRISLLAAAVAAAGCAQAPSLPAQAVDGRLSVEGTIAAIDTAPWAYDGHAVVALDTAGGRVAVQLPARWNLCKAAPVDIAALVVGRRARAVGAATDGGLVVCEGADDVLVPVD